MRSSRTAEVADCRASVRRREILRAGLAGFAGLSLPGLFRLRAGAATPTGRAKTALIVVWLHGGASHLESFDPKPDAPAEYRGPFRPIATRAPGVQLCDLFPRLAAIADRFTVLRSLVHTGFAFLFSIWRLSAIVDGKVRRSPNSF